MASVLSSAQLAQFRAEGFLLIREFCGCLFPDIVTVAVPLTAMDPEHGGLEMTPGSHRCGRLEHGAVGDQVAASPMRVEQLVPHLGVVTVHAAPGDIVLFHCNTLHTSGPSQSPDPRELLLPAYHGTTNVPRGASDHLTRATSRRADVGT